MLYYSDQARARVAALGPDALEAFLEGVPGSLLERNVLRKLPAVPGFRAGSALALKKQKERLIQRLVAPESNKATLLADWRVFLIIWLLWTEHNIDSEDLKDRIRGAYHDKENDNFDQIQNDVVELCNTLSIEKKTSKETLEKFVEFSPFAAEAFTECLEKAVDQHSIESARLLDELPERLSGIDKAIGELGDKLQQAIENIATVSRARDESIQQRDLTTALLPITANLAKVDQTLSDVTARQEELAKDLHSISERFSENSRRLNEFSDVVKRLEERSKSGDALIADLRKRADDVDGFVAALATQTNSNESSSKGRTESNGAVQPAILQRGAIEDARTIEQLGSADDILPHLYRNMLAIGLATHSARQVSSELTAGILSGQLIMIAGSLAELLADVVTKSLCAQQYVDACIPIGFSDSEQITQGLLSSETIVPLLCIHSLNFSSFELYGAPVRSLVLSRQIASPRIGPVVVATVGSGPIALPLSAGITELGPVLDTDSLTWKLTAKGQTQFGQLQPQAFEQKKLDSVDKEVIEAVDGAIRESQVRISEVFSRTWRRAVQQLLWLTDTEYDESLALDSLFSSWIIPYISSAGGAPRTVAKACSGFATNGSAATGRLASALANYALGKP